MTYSRVSFKKRSYAPEILDDFDLQGHDLRQNLKELERVNTLLGGYSSVRAGLKFIFEHTEIQEPVRIADLGCGGGDVLRKISEWFEAENRKVQLFGVDGNPHVIHWAKVFSRHHPSIRWTVADVCGKETGKPEADIVLFNLFLHHFTDEQIITLLEAYREQKSIILVNDLQRSPWAYYLFRMASRIMGFSPISRHDGKLSILKSFTRRDWHHLLSKAGIERYRLRWRWAFRYTLIIY